MRVVGLTGGIATGKSHVAAVLRARGIPVLDADQVARALVLPGSPLLARLAARFGPQIIGEDGTLLRRVLRDLVFSDETARRDLDAIMHPAIWEAVQLELASLREAGHPLAVVEAAILVESGWHRHFDAILVTTCSPQAQIARVVARDGVSSESAMRALASQAPAQAKLDLADAVIDTDAPQEALPERVHHALTAIGLTG